MVFFLFLFCTLLITTANSHPTSQDGIISSLTDMTQNTDDTVDHPFPQLQDDITSSPPYITQNKDDTVDNPFPQLQDEITSSPTDITQNTYTLDDIWIESLDSDGSDGTSQKLKWLVCLFSHGPGVDQPLGSDLTSFTQSEETFNDCTPDASSNKKRENDILTPTPLPDSAICKTRKQRPSTDSLEEMKGRCPEDTKPYCCYSNGAVFGNGKTSRREYCVLGK